MVYSPSLSFWSGEPSIGLEGPNVGAYPFLLEGFSTVCCVDGPESLLPMNNTYLWCLGMDLLDEIRY